MFMKTVRVERVSTHAPVKSATTVSDAAGRQAVTVGCFNPRAREERDTSYTKTGDKRPDARFQPTRP